MSNRWKLLSLAGVTAVLAGCPYHGAVPLGVAEPGQFDARLLGEWLPVDVRGESDPFKSQRLWVMRYDVDEYVVVGTGECPEAGGRAYVTTAGGRRFLNTQEQDEAGRYRIAQVEWAGDTLITRELSDVFDTATTPASLRRMVEARMTDPAMYVREVRRVRSRAVSTTGRDALRLIGNACHADPFVQVGATVPDSMTARALIGSWMLRVRTDSATITIARTEKGGIVATTRIWDWPAGNDDDEKQTVLTTTIGGALFAQIHDPNERGAGGIARVDFAGDTLMLSPVNATVKAEGAVALRRILERQTRDPSIYHWESYRMVRRRGR